MANGFSETAVERQQLSGANWFFWIAGLSLVNTAILISGGGVNFVVGLAVTAIIAAVAAGAEQNVDPSTAIVIKAVAFAVCASAAGVFAGFGFFARRGHVWAFVIGMLLYLIDGLIYLAFGDLLSAGFHAYVLFCLFHGCKAARMLNSAPPANVEPEYAPEVEPLS
ncbi:MAG TPA: hypothetical protein VGN42_18155 [Pirellulales bacterium]|jgi:Na+(H+)/acetate symporter ActP|nr:hypothetical protein [Pirellulales bacterium]